MEWRKIMLAFGFHRVEQFTGLEITRLSPLRFSRIIDLIEDSQLPVLPPESAIGRQGILLTFDDGFASVSESALPILAARGAKAMIFLVAGSVGRSDQWDIRLLGSARPMMNWAQVRYWSERGMVFGSHTLTHADLTVLSPKALREELVVSRYMIEDRIGRPVTTLSYPFGRHNRRVRDAAMEAGYTSAFATFGTDPSVGRFELGRVLVNSLMSLLEIRSCLESYRRGGVLNEHWRGHWRNRFLSSLSAGSATVSSWRRCVSGSGTTRPQFDHEQIVPLSSRWR
ncbi:MAG: hypothetical protein Kow0074_04620 [Candidatus Zixiibacteriota bacterium]